MYVAQQKMFGTFFCNMADIFFHHHHLHRITVPVFCLFFAFADGGKITQ
jgi:hypothetical protein